MDVKDLQYSELPPRAQHVLENFFPDQEAIKARQEHFRDVGPRDADSEGDVEILDGVEFTHHFVDAPGDHETVRFHYVEAGDPANESILFLHGIPDSWYQWHHQMAALASEYHCVAFDLKGYGQSEKSPGDYRHQAAAEQLVAALDLIGLETFNLVTHDRGSVQGDYIAADHSDRVLRYGRGEQHLYHFNPVLAPQADLFAEAPFTGLMNDPVEFTVFVYTWIATHDLPDDEMRRVIQEYSYPGINRAVPRYFNSSTFRQEWIERRLRLIPAWTCPVMILEGYDSKTQPREFYEHARDYIPNAKDVAVRYIQAGHFWSMERPDEVTALLRELLAMPA
ncbi:alpha/beta fold hydrolase [Streptomyces cinereospinus]|uniref:Alpha/beta fold hydrolase n=1 Tax=Streptomyces cinereospinus TaxID=285561 RepID=A0ABV5N7H2_9ACTN